VLFKEVTCQECTKLQELVLMPVRRATGSLTAVVTAAVGAQTCFVPAAFKAR
jgi:hypothetical protein